MTKRNKGETIPDYIDRIFKHLSPSDRDKIKNIVKQAWFDGLRFEREHRKF